MRINNFLKWIFGSVRFFSHSVPIFGLIFVSSFVHSHLVWAKGSKLELARDLYLKGEFQTAYDRLYHIDLNDHDPKRVALIQLFRGILNFELKKFKQAHVELDRSLKMGTRLADIGNFYTGLTYLAQEKNEEAEKAFLSVGKMKGSDFLQARANYHLANLAEKAKNWQLAKVLLKKLERNMRRTDLYPGILFSLVSLYHRTNQKTETCYWAKKLYRNHPTFSQIKDWGLEWKNNKVNDKRLACKDTVSDRKARLRRLQWSGASDKAFAELKVFESSKEKKFDKDTMMAEYLINEGHVQEALTLLLPYYKKENDNFKYYMLLAKAAGRAGEFQTAIGVYTRATKVFRGSKSRTALFRSAFLSYQHQDYDGSLRRFQKLKKKHRGTSLARQANWYIPWLHYLKGDYEEAHKLLRWSIKGRKKRLPRRIGLPQIKYWMAMSLLKMGKKDDAEVIFSKIALDDYIGYYAVASVQRLKELSGGRPLAFSENAHSVTVHENWLPNQPPQDRGLASIASSILPKNREGFFEEWENLPFMQEYLESGKPSQIYHQVATPELRSRIERAKDMTTIGLTNLAKWELYSVEERTKNKDHLKALMYEYHRNGIYHRSSYLSTRHFGEMRTHLGLHLGASLWQFVYPRAFENDVVKKSNEFKVPPEFIWSIMKAETNFRPDAVSPVGAKGLMQVMFHTGRKVASLMGKSSLDSNQLLKPHVSIEIGSRYLQRLLKKFHGKIPLAAAAYNGGPHRVHAWLAQFGHLEMDEFIEHIPFLETRNYVKKVTRYHAVYNLLYNKKNDSSSWLAELVDVYLDGSPPTKETWEVL